ncbi:hypothetical protein [Methanococcus maripaludis]|uniref:Uncharacterized protein n=1 Tax=Methanococcus maripaludis TaxID=39152 RepID=A0A7J9PN98_METMI|nr:hypothetical protein [Methanococcus maripaludis]MBA2864712.1 hypothetical protein [Methanococcus maripaludis]MBB6497566.1 hypothetical protein [Methanococcus maripaludis]
MEELIFQIKKFLPIYLEEENQEYIDYLTGASLANMESKHFQFAFIAFHMLFMSYLYKKLFLLHKHGKITLKDNYNTIFDISKMKESDVFNNIHHFHSNKIDEFKNTVKIRNHCAHSSGFIQYQQEDVEYWIKKEIDHVNKIQYKAYDNYLVNEFKNFLKNEENYDPNRLESLYFEKIERFILENLISVKDLEFFLKNPKLNELSRNSNTEKIIYIKLLYLAIIAVYEKYVLDQYYCEPDIEEGLFIKNLPILMNGFVNPEDDDFNLEDIFKDQFSTYLEPMDVEHIIKIEKITDFDLSDFK